MNVLFVVVIVLLQLKMWMDWINIYIGVVVTSVVLVVGSSVSASDVCHGETMVSGRVFCDQCKDGEINHLDYPLGGELYLLNQILF